MGRAKEYGLLAGALLLAGSIPLPAGAQEEQVTKVLAVVDYVAGNEVYLAAGTDHGIRAGDTLAVYDGEGDGAGLLGVFVIQVANERRSVAAFSGAPFEVSRADVIFLGLPRPLAEARARESRAAAEGAVSENADAEEEVYSAPAAGGQEAPPSPVLWSGRLSLDMDALQTTTRWGDSSEEKAERTFSTPTLRLQARARNLPGGMRLNTSIRLSHRTSPDDVVQPVTSVRFYQFDLEKRFETTPLQLHLGRFHNPFDDFSGYWDGLMVHYGEDGFGAGVAVGFEPDLWNEGLSTDRPKVSGFLDYGARGEAAEYSGVLSFQTMRPDDGSPDRTYLGMSQRIRLGRAWLHQRLQVDRSADGTQWSLTRLQLDASVPLSQRLSLHGGWRRWRAYSPNLLSLDAGPRNDRAGIGLSYWGGAGGLSADVSLDRPESRKEARTVSSSFYLRRTPLLGLGFSGTASYWTRGEDSAVFLSPEVRRVFGPAEVRGAYRYYETSTDFGEVHQQSADLALTFPIGGGFSARLQGFLNWGETLSSHRALASLWKSF